VPAADLIAEALKVGDKIASLSPVAVAMAKQAVNRAFETTLGEGVRPNVRCSCRCSAPPISARHGRIRGKAETEFPPGLT